MIDETEPITTSWLARNRRLAILTTATAVAVLGLAGGAFGIWRGSTGTSGTAGPTTPAATPTASTGTPTASATPSPSPTPSASPTGTPSADQRPPGMLGPVQTAPAATVTGLIVYLTEEPTGDGRVDVMVHRLANGKRQSASIGIGAPDGCLARTATVSPDGTKVAFVLEDPDYRLSVIDLPTGNTYTVTNGISCESGRHPMWVYLHTLRVIRNGETGFLDTDIARFTPHGNDYWLGYSAWAAGGGLTARDGKLTTAAGGQTTIPPLPDAPAEGTTYQGLSLDGRYVVFGPAATGTTIVRTCIAVLDTTTGQRVSLARLIGEEPGPGERLDHVYFHTNGFRVVSSVDGNRVIWRLVSSAEVTVERIDNAPTRMRTGKFTFFM